MDRAGHRGVTLSLVSVSGLVLLGGDVVEPTLSTAGAFALCLVVGFAVAPLPNALEGAVGRGRRGPLHSVFSPLVVAPLLYFSLLGVLTQGQRYLAHSRTTPHFAEAGVLLVAVTVGVTWLGHILVDAASVSRGRFQFAPLTPVSDRPLSLGLYDADSAFVNACSFVVGVVLVAALAAAFCLQWLLGAL